MTAFTIYELDTGRIVTVGDAEGGQLPPEGDLDGIVGCVHQPSNPATDRVVDGGVVGRSAEAMQAEADAAALNALRRARFKSLHARVDQINGLRWAEMSAAERRDLRAYRHALLDLPQSGGDLPVLPVPDPLEAAKRKATSRMLAVIDAAAEALAGDVPQAEMLSWSTKEAAARAQVAGAATAEDIALLQAEADVTSETLGELSARIIARADSYRAVTGQIAGLRRVVTAAIAAAATEEDVAAALLPLAALTGE